jgi:hypothetical protein
MHNDFILYDPDVGALSLGRRYSVIPVHAYRDIGARKTTTAWMQEIEQCME